MLTGISVGMIIVPILALISIDLVPTPIIFASLFLTLLMSLKYKKHIELDATLSISLGMLLGIFIALVFFINLPLHYLGIVFGILILISVLLSIRFPKFQLNSKNGFIGGVIAGTMGALSAVGGQILAMLMQNKKVESIKATLAFLYTFFSTVMLIIFSYFGKFSFEQALVGLYMVPGFIFGFLIGPYCTKYFNAKYIKPIILILATLGAILLMLKSIVQL
jgi:uncharacterized membrane protein YfcA